MGTLFKMIGDQFNLYKGKFTPFGELKEDLVYFWNAYDEAINS